MMQVCDQTMGQTIYQHGLSVWTHLERLLSGDTDTFRLPQWYIEFREQLISTAHSADILKDYAIWHDLGKPLCVQIDTDGRRHFPDHAKVSEHTWRIAFSDHPHCDSIAVLIGLDMIMHTESLDQILTRDIPNRDRVWSSLLLSALAEIHSNAQMFGGIDSTSFKIKWKKLDKLGAKLCKRMFDHSYMYVITRKDLSQPQRAVQAGHAIIEATRAYLTPDCEHPSIVLCGERDEGRLQRLYDTLTHHGVEFKAFYEPDIGHQLTAIATAPVSGNDRGIFKKLQLLK